MQYIEMEINCRTHTYHAFVLQNMQYQDYWNILIVTSAWSIFRMYVFSLWVITNNLLVISKSARDKVVSHCPRIQWERSTVFPEDNNQNVKAAGHSPQGRQACSFSWLLLEVKEHICIFSMTFPSKTTKPTLRCFVYILFVFIFFSVKSMCVYAHRVWLA